MFYCPTPQNSQDFQSHIYQAQHIVIPCFHPFIGKLHRNNQAHQADIKKRADASQHQPSCLLMVVTSHATGTGQWHHSFCISPRPTPVNLSSCLYDAPLSFNSFNTILFDLSSST